MLTQLKEQIKAAETRAYNLKTKKAQSKAWDKVRVLRRQALDILYEASKSYGLQSMKATVATFRPGNEHFMIDTPYGNMWVSPTGDYKSKSWYAHTCCIEYTVGQAIIVEFDTEVNCEGLFLEILPKKMSGGQINGIQYVELCKRDDLAFFKYPDTNEVSGLFSTKKAV